MDIDYEKVEELLRELSQKCGRPSDSGSGEYNIFEVLGVGDKEVIMCRFIGDLLDCKGKHGLRTEPLRLFIKDVLHDENFGDNLDKSEIILEDSTDNGRRVDIAIYLNNKIYPIEVKIWAGDQNEQLKDYHEFYFGKNNNAKIYYLTPNGHSPSDKSKGEGEDKLEDEQIVCISFTKEIKEWLKEVLNIKSASENIKSVIRNFMEVIDKMGQDSRELDNILEKLDKEALDSEAIKGAILLLKHRDEIWNDIRKNYIRSILDCGDKFTLDDCIEKYKNVPQYALFCVKKNGNIVAWICVNNNLYIVARKNGKDYDTSWKPFDNDRLWKRIKYKSHNIPLRHPTVLEKVQSKISLAILLEGRG